MTTDSVDFEARRWKEQVRHALLGAVPTQIGPYELQGQIGRGGMGLVYRGYDRRLRRAVAIKVLRRTEADDASRLRAEARRLAELDHPGIVRVFDVGVFEGRVFVVMPLLEGQTLGAWTRGAVADASRIKVLLRAGHAIAAAHAAGVLHRDIKPANVMVERGEWPQVLDFGHGKALSDRTLNSDGGGPEFTSTGGTPGYVAPEQAAGDPVDERADVYGYCVTALACLSQQTPSPAEGLVCSVDQLEEMLSAAPRRWRKTLRAGIQRDPRHRPRTMDALLSALERTSTRVRWWMVASVVAIGGALAWPPSPGRRPPVAAALKRTSEPAPRVVAMLTSSRELAGGGELAAAQELAHQSVVAAAELDDEVGVAEALALRGRLSARLGDPESALSDLEDAHAMARSRGRTELEFDTGLSTTDVLCDLRLGVRAEAWLRHAEALLPRVNRLGARATWLLSASRVARAQGRLDEAERLVDEAATVDADASLRVAVVTQRGRVELLRGDSKQAVETLSQALTLAREVWPPKDPRLGRILADLGAAHLRHGEVDPAAEVLDEAVRHLALSLGTAHPRYAMTLQNRAIVLWRRGDLDGAIASYRQGVASLEEARGPEHPDVAQALENLSTALIYAGDYDAALQQQNRALVIRESALGSEHASIARTLNYIAQSHEALRQWEQADHAARRAYALAVKSVGREHSIAAEVASARSRIAMGLEKPEDALRFAEEAISIYGSIGAGPLEMGSAHASLAFALCGAPPTCRAGTERRTRASAAVDRARVLYGKAGPAATTSKDALERWASELPSLGAQPRRKPAARLVSETAQPKASTDTQN